MIKNTGQWFIVIILFLLLVGISVFAILHPNNNDSKTSTSDSRINISTDSVKKANEKYKGYSDYIVTPQKINYTIEEIYSKDGKIYIKILDNEIFTTSKNDSTYGVALGNTLSLLMSDFFPSGSVIVIECGDNIVFTGTI